MIRAFAPTVQPTSLFAMRCTHSSPQARGHRNVVPLLALCPLALGHSSAARAQNPPVTINVDATANRRPIDSHIYGVAHATDAQLSDLNTPLNRNGGNNTSRYNWQLNADNRGNDWYFESIGDASATAGERGDTFFTTTSNAGAQAMLTIPTIEWGRRARPVSQQAGELLDRQIQSADGERLAVVSGRRQRGLHELPVRE